MFSELDPRSLVIIASLLALLSAIILLVLHSSFPKTIRGLLHWSVGYLTITAGALLAKSADTLTPFFLNLANVLMVGGLMLVWLGFVYFLERRANFRLPLAALVLMTCVSAWYTYVDPYYPARSMAVSGTASLVYLACAVLLFRHARDSFAGRFTCAVFLSVGLVSGARVIVLLTRLDMPNHLLAPSGSQKMHLAALAFSMVTIAVGAIMMANEKLRAKLKFIASHDALSGAYTRGAFIELLAMELGRIKRDGRPPLALLMCDLDHFKAINDRFGHVSGDRVIADFAHRTMALLRRQDCFGRYGGEEFIILLPDTHLDEAIIVAERIRAMAEESRPDGLPAYTVSIGVSSTTDGNMDVDALLMNTDQALYLAKGNGRNRVALAGTSAAPAACLV